MTSPIDCPLSRDRLISFALLLYHASIFIIYFDFTLRLSYAHVHLSRMTIEISEANTYYRYHFFIA